MNFTVYKCPSEIKIRVRMIQKTLRERIATWGWTPHHWESTPFISFWPDIATARRAKGNMLWGATRTPGTSLKVNIIKYSVFTRIYSSNCYFILPNEHQGRTEERRIADVHHAILQKACIAVFNLLADGDQYEVVDRMKIPHSSNGICLVWS